MTFMELVLGIMFAFVIAFVVGSICQSVWDMWQDLKEEEEDSEPSCNIIPINTRTFHGIPETGEECFDVSRNLPCWYLDREIGADNDMYFIMLYQCDGGLRIDVAVPAAIRKIA